MKVLEFLKPINAFFVGFALTKNLKIHGDLRIFNVKAGKAFTI